VPKPDQIKLDGRPIDLQLDFEMTIESGKDAAHGTQGALQPSDTVPPVSGANGRWTPN
jgi:hypothetical protein